MENYREIRQIGHGNFGAVYLVEKMDTGEKFVVKKIPIYDMNPEEKEQAKQEVALLSSLNHPCIVRYIDSFLQEGSLHLVQEYCAGGDLSYRIKLARKSRCYFDENQILDWLSELTLAIAYIHKRRILHRDLKSQNIFLTSNNIVRLGDFGIARVLEHTFQCAKTVVGTPFYMSPEVCENKDYNAASDIWALGCVIYELCTLKHAFTSSNLLGLVYKIVQERHPPIPAHYSNELKALVDCLLSKDPSKRLDAESILQLPFISYRIQKLSLGLSTAGNTINSLLLPSLVSPASIDSKITKSTSIPTVSTRTTLNNPVPSSSSVPHSATTNTSSSSTDHPTPFSFGGNVAVNDNSKVIVTSPPLLSPSIFTVPLPGSRYATESTDPLVEPQSSSTNDASMIITPPPPQDSRMINVSTPSSSSATPLIIPNDDTLNLLNNTTTTPTLITPHHHSSVEPPQSTPRPQHQRNITVEIVEPFPSPLNNQNNSSNSTATPMIGPVSSLPIDAHGSAVPKNDGQGTKTILHLPSASIDGASITVNIPSNHESVVGNTIPDSNASKSRRPSQIQTQFPTTPNPDNNLHTATSISSTTSLSTRSPLPTTSNNSLLARSPLGLVNGGNVNRRRPSLASAQAIMNAAVNNSTNGSNTPSYMMNDPSINNSNNNMMMMGSPFRTVSSRSNSIVGTVNNSLLPMQSPPGFELLHSVHNAAPVGTAGSGEIPSKLSSPLHAVPLPEPSGSIHHPTVVPLALPSRFLPNPETVGGETSIDSSSHHSSSTISVSSIVNTARQEIDHPPVPSLTHGPKEMIAQSRRSSSSLSYLQPLPHPSIIPHTDGRPPSATPRRTSIRRLEPLGMNTQGIYPPHPTVPSDTAGSSGTDTSTKGTPSTSLHRQSSAENGIGGFTVDANAESLSTVSTEILTPPIVVRRQSTLNRITNESTGINDEMNSAGSNVTPTNAPGLIEPTIEPVKEPPTTDSSISTVLAYPSPESSKGKHVLTPSTDVTVAPVPVSTTANLPSQFFNFDDEDDYDDIDFQSFQISSLSSVPKSRRSSSVLSNLSHRHNLPPVALTSDNGNSTLVSSVASSLSNTLSLSQTQDTITRIPSSNARTVMISEGSSVHIPPVTVPINTVQENSSIDNTRNTIVTERSKQREDNDYATLQAIAQVYMVKQQQQQQQQQQPTVPSNNTTVSSSNVEIPINFSSSSTVSQATIPGSGTNSSSSNLTSEGIPTTPTRIPFPKSQPSNVRPRSSPNDRNKMSTVNKENGNDKGDGSSNSTLITDRSVTPENLPAMLPTGTVPIISTSPSLSTVPIVLPSSSSVYARYDNLSSLPHHQSPSSYSSSTMIPLVPQNILSPATYDRVRKLYVDPAVTPTAGVSRSNSRVSTPLSSYPAVGSPPKGLLDLPSGVPTVSSHKVINHSSTASTPTNTTPTGSPSSSQRHISFGNQQHSSFSPHHPSSLLHPTSSRPVSRSTPNAATSSSQTLVPRPSSSSTRPIGSTRSQPIRTVPIYTLQNIEILRNKCKSSIGEKTFEKLHALLMERVQNDTNGNTPKNTSNDGGASSSSSSSSLRNRAFTARLLDILNGNRALLPVCAEIEQLIYMEIVVIQNHQNQTDGSKALDSKGSSNNGNEDNQSRGDMQ